MAFSGTWLPDGYQPTEVDFICGRGKKVFDHAGNQYLRNVIIPRHTEDYERATKKVDKSIVVNVVICQFQQEGGQFIKFNHKTRRWGVVENHSIREKVVQCLRLNDQPRVRLLEQIKQVHERSRQQALLEVSRGSNYSYCGTEQG
uniref:DUF6824 domain-containing protein n=1 Tax=Cyclophora tenuis TaxID=216820 RepID=A0A6U1PLK6_CYCTE|mmetsp:Transcript_14933/g.25336  ORF Transcript_14933/g.25336 Transcript_14933/m.25336 type:complete len:145 (+) Transcript_14933:267-701(+)|eukprot:CAMPEP_0116579184 /NCGR_PEP_ID=MMETSP0397-20121206/22117_1 /TAXON_ID=216820 /ORGANISM="Cyclophora tenuis, Strain ECT3854" /LENGTH=144 /DNA_ID=CAMNT_0004108649 /DNA_START=250 /DNA_END=684 /DNA_ORIENTATION=+